MLRWEKDVTFNKMGIKKLENDSTVHCDDAGGINSVEYL